MKTAHNRPGTCVVRKPGRAMQNPRLPWRLAGTAAFAWTAAAGLLWAGAATLCPSAACVIPSMDSRTLEELHALRTPWLTACFSAVTWLGSMWVLLPTAAALCAWQYHKSNRALALLPPLALTGGWLLAHLTKFAVARPRPDLHETLITLPADSSFPSAHTLQIAAFSLAALLAANQQRNWLATFFALLTVSLVALSRLYLQVHFPSDVLFGLLAAMVWTGGLYYAMARTP